MNNLRLLISVLMLSLSTSLLAQNASKILITIGDEPITAEEFWSVYQKNNTNNSIDKKSLKEYLDLYTVFKLKVYEAKQLRKDTLPRFAKELKGYRKQLAKPYLTDENIHDQLIQEAYQRMQKAIRASHILIMTPQGALPADTLKAYEKIGKIREEIMSGSISFADAAVKYSDDRSARDMPPQQGRPARKGNKGDLGFFTVFDMVYPFEVAAYQTPIGEVSPIVRTRYGYHLIKKTDEIKAFGRAQVAHIYIKDMEGDTARDEAAAKAKIDEAVAKLAAGEMFEDVVKTMSEDKASIPQGGALPWFEANRMVPEFIKQVTDFDSVGQVSQPIHTSFGWHIVKLIGLEPVKSFEDNEQKIKERLKKDVRSAKGKASKVAQIKAAEGFEAYPEVLQPLADTVNVAIADFATIHFDKEAYPTPLCKVGNQVSTIGDFLEYIRKYETQATTREGIQRIIYKYYPQFTDDQCIAYENNQLEDKYPEFALLMNEYRDGILLFDLMDEMVWSKAVKDTTGYQDYYQAHQQDYRWDTRADVGVFTILKPEIADSLQLLAKQGLDEVAILQSIQNDSLHRVKYERKSLEKGQMPEVDKMKWKKGKMQMFYSAANTPQYFIIVYDKLQPATKALDECRGKVISDYQKVLEDKWVEELSAKYPIEINQALVKELETEGLKK